MANTTNTTTKLEADRAAIIASQEAAFEAMLAREAKKDAARARKAARMGGK